MPLVGPPILRGCLPQHCPPAGIPPSTIPQNPCTQLFFSINHDNTPPDNLVTLLNRCWEHDPLTTLKIICYLRALRGGERNSHNESFCLAALWLHQNHPLTLACNRREFAGFGSLRDFPEILYRLVNEGLKTDQKKSFVSAKERDIENARRAVCKYVQDTTYRFLHERVSDLVADLLTSDLLSLSSGRAEALSSASLGCPSVDSSYDRHTLICESIAKKVFPRESDPEYVDIKDVYYVYRVRNRLRKEVLAPLRAALEGKVGKERGDLHPHDLTLALMKKAYQKMLKMKDKGSKIRYYQIMLQMILKTNNEFFPSNPVSIVSSVNDENYEAKDLEWKNMVQSLSKNEKLKDSVVVCDVSEGMGGARSISITMGLLISELSNTQWKNVVYSFNGSPEPCKIEGADLISRVNFMKQLESTERVNVEAFLRKNLQEAMRQKLSKEKMVKRVFVFTNKPFRKAVNNCWGWNYRAVWENYCKYGYEDCIPEIVFWNVEGVNASPPVTRHALYNRLLMIDGFSRSLLAFFLAKDAVWRSSEIQSVNTAEDVMRITLSGKQYQNLVVLD